MGRFDSRPAWRAAVAAFGDQRIKILDGSVRESSQPKSLVVFLKLVEA
jgi:hypothetical protein